MATDTKAPELDYRLAVLSRTVAAIFGSYALAVTSTFAVAALVMGRDGIQLGAMIGFLLYTGGVIWCFATASAWRAWAGIAIATALCELAFLAAGGGA
ncbi:MAG: DUF3649 domain-containing protein [Novosphingobium sp.]